MTINNMKNILVILALLTIQSTIAQPIAAQQPHPNVVLVMCDDLGWGDPQCFDPESLIRTPNINAMAEAGLMFNRFYSAAPVCSPTRGSCLTGRHPYRYGIYSANKGHLREDEVTLPEILKGRRLHHRSFRQMASRYVDYRNQRRESRRSSRSEALLTTVTTQL